jgi:hypothetical protein
LVYPLLVLLKTKGTIFLPFTPEIFGVFVGCSNMKQNTVTMVRKSQRQQVIQILDSITLAGIKEIHCSQLLGLSPHQAEELVSKCRRLRVVPEHEISIYFGVSQGCIFEFGLIGIVFSM